MLIGFVIAHPVALKTLPLQIRQPLYKGRFSFRLCVVVAPLQQSNIIATGISNAIPNAKNSLSTKPK